MLPLCKPMIATNTHTHKNATNPPRQITSVEEIFECFVIKGFAEKLNKDAIKIF